MLNDLWRRIRTSLSRKEKTMTSAIVELPAAVKPDDLGELQRSLTEVTAQLDNPLYAGDVGALIRRRHEITQQIVVARARADHAANAAYRARIVERRAKFVADLNEANELLADALPKMQYALVRHAELLNRLEEYGESITFEEMTNGLKFDHVHALQAAIADSLEEGSPLSDPYMPPWMRAMFERDGIPLASEPRRRVRVEAANLTRWEYPTPSSRAWAEHMRQQSGQSGPDLFALNAPATGQ